VLPLVPDFLTEHAADIATSRRTAERLITEFKTANPQYVFILRSGGFKSAKFWTLKQRRPSLVAFFADTPNGTSIASLERLFGPVTVQVSSVEVEDDPLPASQETVTAEKPPSGEVSSPVPPPAPDAQASFPNPIAGLSSIVIRPLGHVGIASVHHVGRYPRATQPWSDEIVIVREMPDSKGLYLSDYEAMF
jgi:hypothetical protein